MAVDAAALREGAQAGARGDEGGVGRGGERGWGGGGGGGEEEGSDSKARRAAASLPAW